MKFGPFTWITRIILVAALALSAQVATQGQTTNFRSYKLIDIGSFGGPVSYLPNDFTGSGLGIPALINDKGTIVGAADTSIPNPTHGIGSGFLPDDPVIVHAFQWEKGILTDLGALPGGYNSFANWVSKSGLVAGVSENGVIDPQFGIAQVNAVVWKQSEIINLGGYFSEAFAVNNSGQATGSTVDTAALPTVIFLAFLWQHGQMETIGTLGGPGSFAVLINEKGQVAGTSFINSSASSNCPFPLVTHPFLWGDGKMMDLGTFGGTCGLALGLNNRGQVVGLSNLAGDQTVHPFLWDKGTLSDLGTLGGTFGFAQALNDAGEIAGAATNQGDEALLPFFWKNGVMTNLGTLNGEPCSTAQGMNSRGQVVGVSADCTIGGNAWLWESGGPLIDLNTLVGPSSLALEIAENINDRGEIAGLGRPPGCDEAFDCGHAFVLIPICADGTEGCADAPLDPAVVAQSRATLGAAPKTMTAEELSTFKERIARMHARVAGRNPGFGLWPRR